MFSLPPQVSKIVSKAPRFKHQSECMSSAGSSGKGKGKAAAFCIDLTNDSDNNSDSPPPPSAKKRKRKAGSKPATAAARLPSTGFALIWVCHHGPSQSGRWSKKRLNVVGVYATKVAAEAAQQQLLDQHTQAGHGDILVGDYDEDEIDLIIRKTSLHF